jgi:hypothetical protein
VTSFEKWIASRGTANGQLKEVTGQRLCRRRTATDDPGLLQKDLAVVCQPEDLFA